MTSNVYTCYFLFLLKETHAIKFLNQAIAGLWPAHTWFLKIVPVWLFVCVYVFVCVSAPKAIITSGVMWRDMDSI